MSQDVPGVVDQDDPNIELRGAGGTERYFAACIDNAFAWLMVLAVAAVVSENMPRRAGTAVSAIVGFGVIMLYFAYFFVFESLFATTPGKFGMSLRIRKLDGSRAGWQAAFVRTALRIVEVNPFLLGCIPAAILIWKTPRRQRWGDKLAGTVVVSIRDRR